MENAINRVKEAIGAFAPETALVLGSGLGFLADELEDAICIPYAGIDGFPRSTAPGHAGRLVAGILEGQRVLCFQGRFHFYEGYGMSEVTAPVRLAQALGVSSILLTNAAGGINRDYAVGDFMLLRDHINYLGTNPLIGPNPAGFPRFPDMTQVYCPKWRQAIVEANVLVNEKSKLHQGVYLATTGPSYETPAEIRMFGILGADAVGMSTVPEAIVSRHRGLQVVAISCITNAAAGHTGEELSEEEVIETADRVRVPFSKLVRSALAIRPRPTE